jgi:hypothetical protein
MRSLYSLLDEIHSFIIHKDKIQPAVSSVSVGWHLEHILLVIVKTVEAVSKSNPNNYQRNFNFIRLILFTINRFPRGKGKAPAVVQPSLTVQSDLNALFDDAKNALEILKKTHPNQYYKHPVFGILNKKNTYIMTDIHIRHHLSIIRDIVSSVAS